jgi:hypothetical protein
MPLFFFCGFLCLFVASFLWSDAAGIVRSETFPGLWLDVNAMLRRDGIQVSKVLQQGIVSPEHAEFVERLRLNAEKKG